MYIVSVVLQIAITTANHITGRAPKLALIYMRLLDKVFEGKCIIDINHGNYQRDMDEIAESLDTWRPQNPSRRPPHIPTTKNKADIIMKAATELEG